MESSNHGSDGLAHLLGQLTPPSQRPARLGRLVASGQIVHRRLSYGNTGPVPGSRAAGGVANISALDDVSWSNRFANVPPGLLAFFPHGIKGFG